MTASWPHMNLLSQMLNHFMNRIVMMTFGWKFFFRIIRRGGCWTAGVVSAIDTILRNARVEVFDKGRIIKSILWRKAEVPSLLVSWMHLVPEQRVPLGFRCNCVFIVAVILICSGVRKILMVRFVFINVVEIMRKESGMNRWRMTV